MCAVEIEHFSCDNVLIDAELKIEKNTFNLLMSENAKGKTEFLNSIVLPEEIMTHSLKAIINGTHLTKANIKSAKKSIGYVPQQQIFVKHVVSEEILFCLLNLGNSLKTSKKKMYETTRKLGIDHLLTRNTSTLSESEKILVSIAIVLACEFEIVIVDNPMDSLNYKLRQKAIYFLKNMTKKSTIIFSTNDPEDIYIADNIIVIIDNKIKCYRPNELISDEKSFYKINSKLPVMSELSEKLILYKIINEPIFNEEEMIKAIWK